MSDWIDLGKFVIVNDNSVYIEGEKLEPGNRVLLISETNEKGYFIAKSVELSENGYIITLYGGNKFYIQKTVKQGYFSKVKTPEGFPLDPDIWTVYYNVWDRFMYWIKTFLHKLT